MKTSQRDVRVSVYVSFLFVRAEHKSRAFVIPKKAKSGFYAKKKTLWFLLLSNKTLCYAPTRRFGAFIPLTFRRDVREVFALQQEGFVR